MSLNRVQMYRSAIASAVVLAATLASVAPSSAVSQCVPRYVSQNIKNAVLAMKAAQYCEGMPYTIGEAAHRVEAMRCNSQASEIIDELLADPDQRYRQILKDHSGIACQQAALIDW